MGMCMFFFFLSYFFDILIDFNGWQINCNSNAAKRSAENVVILNSIMNT